uniref:C2H2-type domain-containing protein n=1 Tax=Glossina brevipalpis TaxID=37001 RepID=A0A1A9WMP4_9MUSC
MDYVPVVDINERIPSNHSLILRNCKEIVCLLILGSYNNGSNSIESNSSNHTEYSNFNHICTRSNNSNALPSINNSPSSSACNSHLPCRVCGRIFTTKTDVVVHMRYAQPNGHVEQNPSTDFKSRWREEEDVLLVKKEFELIAIGTKYMNKVLARLVLSRSLKAFKKTRQKVKYRQRVKNDLAMTVF